MATQKEVAEWLGMSHQAVSKQMAEIGIDYRIRPIKEIVQIYTSHLRRVAAQHTSADGKVDLIKERGKKESLECQILEIKLAESLGQVINVAEFEKKYSQMISNAKAEFLASAEKIKTIMFTVYGVDIDITYINDINDGVLQHLAQYEPVEQIADSEIIEDLDSSGEADDNPMGKKTSGDKRKGKRNTRKIQP